MQRALGLSLALSAALATRAEAQAITFDEALALGDDAPDVRGADRALEARRRGDEGISDITHPTEIQVVPGVRVLSEQDRGFEGSIGISQGWSLSGLPGARRRAAEDERAALAAQRRVLALTHRLDAARAWIDLRVLERQVELATEEHRTAEEALARVERALEAGVVTAADVADVRAFTGELRLAMLTAEARRLGAMLALAEATGRAPVHGLRTAGASPDPELPSYERLEALLMDVDDLPEVVAARLESIAARTREVELAAASGPTLATGVQAYREAPSGVIVFGLLTLGLPLADLAARDRSIALAEIEEREAELEARSLAAMRSGFAVAHEVDHTRREEAVLETEVVPALDELASVRQRQLHVGETTVVLALDARRRRIAAHARLAQAEGAATWAAVRAWMMLAAREGGEEDR